MYNFDDVYQNTENWLLLYREVKMQLSSAIIDFHLFYNRPVDMKIWAPLTRSQCRFSDTQVTVKTGVICNRLKNRI